MIQLKLNNQGALEHFNTLETWLRRRINAVINHGAKVPADTVPSFPSLNLTNYLNNLLAGQNLKMLITMSPEELKPTAIFFINHFSDFVNPKHPDCQLLYNIFISSCYEQEKYFSKLDFIERFNLDTCPYCNRQYIYSLSKTKKIKPELDHFYHKSKYPFFGLSFYNLIPSCSVCNGYGGKHHSDAIDKRIVSPYLLKTSEFAFSYTLNSPDFFGGNLSKKTVTVNIDSDHGGNLEVFKLRDLYNRHSDHVIELIAKSKFNYNKKFRDFVKGLVGAGFSNAEIDRLILGNYSTEEEIHKRPLAKMYQDIGKDLGLI